MSSYKVIFFPKALKGIATYTYPADGQTEARGTCPNAQHGWVEAAAGSHPVGVQLSLAQQVRIRLRDISQLRGVLQPCWG